MRKTVFLSLILVICALTVPGTTTGTPQVFILAVDGASDNVIHHLLSRRKLPHMAELMPTVFSAPLDSGPGDSPVKWTTLFSGTTMDVHGVLSFTDNERILTSANCRVKRVWEILSERNQRVAVFRVFATWPAEPLNGVLLSDRWSPAGRQGFFQGDRKRTVYPSGIGDKLNAAFDRRLTQYGLTKPHVDFPSFLSPGWTHARISALEPGSVGSQIYQMAHLVGRTYVFDRSVADVALQLTRESHFDLVILYLRGIDYVSHFKWKESLSPNGADFVIRAGSPVERYYELVDEIVGEVVDELPESSYFFLLSDHGFNPTIVHEPGKPALSGGHSLHGVFCLKGPGVQAGQRTEVIDGLDVTPTLLGLFGIPVSEQMPGKSLLSPEKLPRVASYEKPRSSFTPPPVPPEEREELKQLNYLK